MSGDIRIIRLCRKSVGEINETVTEGAAGQDFFATDYFDILRTEKKDLTHSFSDIMNISQGKELEDGEISVQSYSLYFSDKMWACYEKDRVYAKNPFDDEDFSKGKPFLSVIQVHITPEVLGRMEYDEKSLWNDYSGDKHTPDTNFILKPFLDDLYHILDSFQNNNQKDSFVARVYLTLSAGDFAVVVRSKEPETSYMISTRIRCRNAGERENQKSEGFVIYKTYTLLTMKNSIIGMEEIGAGKSEGETENRFVVRGCYSNKYWASKKLRSEALNLLGSDDIEQKYHLNGRYDFSVQLPERDFFEIFPVVEKYKRSVEISEILQESSSPVVKFLYFLIKNQCLSYINERYLLSCQKMENNYDQESRSHFIYLAPGYTNRTFILNINKDYISQVMSKYEEVSERMEEVKEYRKKVGQYMLLLKKEILLCSSINGMSDTRIYARVLAEQLEIVLDSLGIYTTLFANDGNKVWDLLDLIEYYLRESVCALDTYAQYIRNNNLQSLQTPNYNIESNMGMEKILIGYSELLCLFMELYFNLSDSERDSEQDKETNNKEYLPVLVPNLDKADVSVEVMFPEGNGEKWEDEAKRRESPGNKYLIVVSSSTFEELSDVPLMMSILFHEVAHQFRYEDRKSRNDCLLEAAVTNFMSGFASRIASAVDNEIAANDTANCLYYLLRDSMADACLQELYKKEGTGRGISLNYDFQDTPLYYFQRKLEEDLAVFVNKWHRKDKLQERVKDFLQELRCCVVFDDNITVLIVKLKNKLDTMPNISGNETKFEHIEKYIKYLQKCIFSISWICAYNSLSSEEQSGINGAGISRHEWLSSEWLKDDSEMIFEKEWEKSFGNIKSKIVSRIWKECLTLNLWLEDEFKFHTNIFITENRTMDIDGFFAKLYQIARDHWDEVNINCKSSYDPSGKNETDFEELMRLPSYHYWALVGRYLGIDHNTEDNQKKFRKKITDMTTDQDGGNFDVLIANYREKTSDILMCSIMDLDPFAYINLISYAFVKDFSFDDIYLDRVFCVLFMKWCCCGENKEKDWENYRELCIKILNSLQEYCEPDFNYFIKENICVDTVNGLKSPGSKFTWPDETEETEKNLWTGIMCFRDGLRKLITKMMDAAQKSAHEYSEENVKNIDGIKQHAEHLKNAISICSIMIRLVRDGRNCYSKLNQSYMLCADYIKGVECFKNIVKKMEKGNEAAGYFMGDLKKLCAEIAIYLKKSCSQYGSKSDQRLNQRGIEFLIKMYYNNKIRNAQKCSGSSVGGDMDEH